MRKTLEQRKRSRYFWNDLLPASIIGLFVLGLIYMTALIVLRG